MTDYLQFGLHRWPKPVKGLCIGFLILLFSGVSVGLIYLNTTTSLSTTGTIEHYNGSDISDASSLNIPEKYAKPVSELLLTTHNHFIGFSFIFILLGGFFYFNTTITGRLKSFLIIEPFFSTWITFASIWGIRYLDSAFVYLTFVGAIITYCTFYLMVFILLYELSLKKED
jgi:hypothetical protein